ncbi:PIP-like protein [Mya arenaria]|uniref:prolyl aminopeptidase n=1 Tax=Mya arenaria TaxID=6604 RepID=A0ABY7D923_MYAAR|nr:PIP-like protein [Mya arenaria]
MIHLLVRCGFGYRQGALKLLSGYPRHAHREQQPEMEHVRVTHRTMSASVQISTPRAMYPDIEPYETGMLKVSDLHTVYYEQSGNPDGKPVIFLHGGPGGGTSPRDRTFFDPSVYRIVLMDQRGAGKSTPPAELRSWVVFGGSWGSTLALVYAIKHADRVKALVLRGIFNLRRKELLWLYQEGANFIFPDEYEAYVKPIPEVERFDLMSAFYRCLTGNNEDKKIEAAKAWSRWEMALSRLYLDPANVLRAEADKWALHHYFVHGGFMEKDDWILANVNKIRNIPTTIIQGRYDIICPAITAWDLHKSINTQGNVSPETDVPDIEPYETGMLKENTTWNLVSDIELLRRKLVIDQWVVFGGSWGSTLGLVYAIQHPDRVKALILRGIFMVRRKELIWLYQEGASYIFPDEFELFVKPVPEVERRDVMSAYYRRLTCDDTNVQRKVAKAWSRWEVSTLNLYLDQAKLLWAEDDPTALQVTRIECHYFVHGAFFEKDEWILANIDKIRHIPTTIIQGHFHLVPDAGHTTKEPGIQTQLLDACDKYKHL